MDSDMEAGAVMVSEAGEATAVGEVTEAGEAVDVLPRMKPNLNLLHKLVLRLVQRLSAGVISMEAMVSADGAVMVSEAGVVTAVGAVTEVGEAMDVLHRVRANLKLTANATTEEEDAGAVVEDVVAVAEATIGEHLPAL